MAFNIPISRVLSMAETVMMFIMPIPATRSEIMMPLISRRFATAFSFSPKQAYCRALFL